MRLKSLEKSIGHRVQIRPVARRFDEERELPQVDDDWIIRRVTNEGVELLNTRTNHCPTLGTDHIYSYSTDPDRSRGGVPHGKLILLVQLILRGNGVFSEPVGRPGDSNPGPVTIRS